MPEQVPYTGDGVTASKTGWPIVRSVEAPHIPLHTGRGARPSEKAIKSVMVLNPAHTRSGVLEYFSKFRLENNTHNPLNSPNLYLGHFYGMK